MENIEEILPDNKNFKYKNNLLIKENKCIFTKSINLILYKAFIFFFLYHFLIIIYYSNKYDKNIINTIPLFNINIYEYNNKKYNITKYNKKHIRYHFHDKFKYRKKFLINYSYLPYHNIDKSISYEENADKIYKSTGMLNVTKLDYFYFNNISSNYLNFNHIHLSTGFDKNYIYLSSVSFASILNTSNPDTFIHFHLIILDSNFEDMKKLIQLKKINKNVEFIFYNGEQTKYDFGHRNKKEYRGIGDYAKMLLPEIVNNTNKIIIMDSGDIIACKDLSEIYFFELEDNYFGWTLEYFAGNSKSWNKFSENNFYPNGGICLVNVSLFRKDRLYERAYFTSLAYNYLQCPYQEIFFFISVYRFKYLPLNYNCKQFYDNNKEMALRKKNTKYIKFYTKNQKFSPFKYEIEEIINASLNPVILHIYHEKIYLGTANKEFTIQWIKYVELTGFYKEIKQLYPKPFKLLNYN